MKGIPDGLMQTSTPARKVIGGSVAAALSTILIYLIDAYVFPVPVEVGGAITTVMTFLVGYYLPPSPADQVVANVSANV